MKPMRSIQYLVGAALLCSVASQGDAQAPPGLSLATYAGLTITGSVGRVYTVQYNTNVAQPDGWRGAGIVQLPSSPAFSDFLAAEQAVHPREAGAASLGLKYQLRLENRLVKWRQHPWRFDALPRELAGRFRSLS